jgi:aminopeptidase N
VEQDDLFRNLQKAVDEDFDIADRIDVKTVLDSWTLQKGFPLLKVSVGSESFVKIEQVEVQLKPHEIKKEFTKFAIFLN